MTHPTPSMGYPPGTPQPAHGTVTPSFREFLPSWLRTQRWWRSGSASATRVGAARWEDPHGAVGLDLHLVATGQGPDAVVYHVPLSYRGHPLEQAPETALLATVEHSQLGTRWIYDAVHDPVYLEQAVRRCLGTHDVTLTGHRLVGGEQSNSSVVVHLRWPDGRTQDLMLKVFRVLHEGANPEVTAAEILTRVGCPATPGLAGAWEASWLPAGHGDVIATGHALVLNEFIPNAQDGWARWVEAATESRPVDQEARELGAAIARVHEALGAAAEPLSSRAMTLRAQEIHQEWTQRWAHAVVCAPELEPLTQRAQQVFQDAADDTPWPQFHTVHGDLHLGQVLHSPSRGWVVVDFEGEPLRAMEERAKPDQPLRDVAGLLRSVGYAAATAAQHAASPAQVQQWRAATERALLEGYAGQFGACLPSALLTAFVLDKAAYEVAYDAAHRPHWMAIPVSAVRELLCDEGA